MVRGTTPTLTFTLPFPVSTLSALYINISQHYESIQIEKSLSDCTISGNDVSVILTQDDTLKLVAGRQAFIQVRVRTSDGTALASEMIPCMVEDVLKDGVI